MKDYLSYAMFNGTSVCLFPGTQIQIKNIISWVGDLKVGLFIPVITSHGFRETSLWDWGETCNYQPYVKWEESREDQSNTLWWSVSYCYNTHWRRGKACVGWLSFGVFVHDCCNPFALVCTSTPQEGSKKQKDSHSASTVPF